MDIFCKNDKTRKNKILFVKITKRNSQKQIFTKTNKNKIRCAIRKK